MGEFIEVSKDELKNGTMKVVLALEVRNQANMLLKRAVKTAC